TRCYRDWSSDVCSSDLATTNVARWWSTAMASATMLSHNPQLVSQINSQVTADWTRIGENVGVGGDVDSLNQAFWNSPAHRANVQIGRASCRERGPSRRA